VLNQVPHGDGVFPTAIPFLSLIRFERPTRLTHAVLQPSICLVLRGSKRILIGSEAVAYACGAYVISAVDMLISGQITRATKTAPYLGVKIDLDPQEIASILVETEQPLTSIPRTTLGAFVSGSTSDLQDAVLRLVALLQKPQDMQFLASPIRREIIYRLLTDENSPLLYQSVLATQGEAGIGKAITTIKRHYQKPLAIEMLAKQANMSISGLRHRFKEVTGMAPLQYQKRIRLQEARSLLLRGEVDAAGAAFAVGYESPSQFSREFKRLYGSSPIRDLNSRNGNLLQD
jgi:AraC-like DNA-binding protein